MALEPNVERGLRHTSFCRHGMTRSALIECLLRCFDQQHHIHRHLIGQAIAGSGHMCLAELRNGNADSAGPRDDAQDLTGAELDIRDRIYDMVRPLDWMEEAPEPPGAAAASLFLEQLPDSCRWSKCQPS